MKMTTNNLTTALFTLCLVLAGLLSSVVFTGPVHAARDVGEKRECATCHVMWLNAFKQKDVQTLVKYDPKPVEKTGRQDVASTDKMCFSCHDGFVLDSREVWRGKGHSHPVGMKPSSRIRIPTSKGKVVFPMNEDGKMYCGTCHTAHGVDWSDKESPVFMRVKNVESSLCLACHLDKSTGPAEGNHPVFKRLKNFPRALKQAGAMAGSGNSVICQSCHVAHEARAKKMLVESADSAKLCGSCHTDKKDVVGTKHDMGIMDPDVKNRNGETVAESGTCSACHVPHNGKGPALWARARVKDVDPAAASCLGCHNEDGPAKKKILKGHNHPVGQNIDRLGFTIKDGQWHGHKDLLEKNEKLEVLPLYNKQGLRNGKAEYVGCGSCHDPHRWSANSTDKDKKPDPKDTEGDATNSFLRIADTGKSDLCVNCHVNKRSVLLSKHNHQIFDPEKAKRKGSEVGRGTCEACHQPHNARGAALWARETGPGKGRIEQLCTGCHNKDGIAKDKLPGEYSHPVGMPLKTGMKTDFPLFGNDRHKSENNMDCATCHNLHQWSPVNVADRSGASMKVEGDASNSFLRKDAHDSKLCVECHKEKDRVLKTEHDLNITAPNATNSRGQNVRQSGVCGQCHAVHQAKAAMALWARKIVEPEGKNRNHSNAMNALCMSCHSKGEVAENKQPISYKHPKEAILWSQEIRDSFGRKASADLPVFDKKGKPADMGAIACATCHNPHQWEADKNRPGPGKNTEGDVRNSFLRASHTKNIVCGECHGEEAIFRYKYFHGKSSHKKYPMAR